MGWLEVISENFMGLRNAGGGQPVKTLQRVREHYPVSLHGVSMSIGSVDPLDEEYLSKLRNLADRIEPIWVSDHLCWTGVDGENLHDLLPLPYTQEALDHIVPRLAHAQERLGRTLLIENVSTYIACPQHETIAEMTEAEFLRELSKRTDCSLLLDINNVYVSAVNHGFDPYAYLTLLPRERIAEIHLAGHTDMGSHLIDTHDHPVPDPVWDLYSNALQLFGPISTLIERDAKIPPLPELEKEVLQAQALLDMHTRRQ